MVPWSFELLIGPYTRGVGDLSIVANEVEITVGFQLREPDKACGEWVVSRAQVVIFDFDLAPDDTTVKFMVSPFLSEATKALKKTIEDELSYQVHLLIDRGMRKRTDLFEKLRKQLQDVKAATEWPDDGESVADFRSAVSDF